MLDSDGDLPAIEQAQQVLICQRLHVHVAVRCVASRQRQVSVAVPQSGVSLVLPCGSWQFGR